MNGIDCAHCGCFCAVPDIKWKVRSTTDLVLWQLYSEFITLTGGQAEPINNISGIVK